MKLWLFAFVGAAIAEISGCFAFWAWLRLGKSQWWLVPGTASLILFAYLLTAIDTEHAGRSYAAYGGMEFTRFGGRLRAWHSSGFGVGLLDGLNG